MKKILPYVSHEEERARLFRKDPKRATEYLNACIEVAFKENDPDLILTALALVAKSYGMTNRMLSKRGNPEWNSIFRVFNALHLRPRLERAA